MRKRDWKTPEQMTEVFALLAEQDLKVADVTWMLSDPDRMVRQHATRLIVAQRMAGAGITLLRDMKDATGPARSYLLSILPQLNDDTLIPAIEKMLAAKEKRDRETAVDVVLAFPAARVDGLLVGLLADDNRENRYRALNKLVADRKEGQPFSDSVRKHVLALLGDKDERIRIRCVQLLAEQPTPEVADRLVELLAQEDYNVKTAIIKVLDTLMGRPELAMVDRLLPLLSQSDDMLRSAVLELAVKHADPKEIIRKILLMQQQLMGWMRDRILTTIKEQGADLLQPIIELLDHSDENVRTSALMFASSFDSPKLVEPAVKLLKARDWWARIIAMDLLGRLRDERAVDPLVACLGDEEVRWSAVEALSRIGSKKSLGPIAKLLSDKSPEVRLQVIQALELFKDHRTLPLLKRSMERDPEVEVRERAMTAYKVIADHHKQQVDEAELRSAFAYGKTERRIDKLLTEARRVGASDLHVSPGSVPIIRHNGELRRIGQRELSDRDTYKMVREMLDPRQLERFEAAHQLDFCYVIPGVGRYRANIYAQRLGLGGVFRTIPNEVPAFLDTRLPEHLQEIAYLHQGLVVVAGPSGSGKSTTLAALVNLVNERKPAHILTLEDPIEFVHPYKQSLVNQREIGKHSDTFASALRAALREDPDVIVVGELRDQETMALAMTAAETGHLVIATMNTTSAVKTVDRLVEAFPPREQPSIRMMLSESLKVVIGQNLMRRADKKAMVPYHEVLMITGPVRNLIRDSKTMLIPSAMTVGKEHGMRTVDMALQELVQGGLASPEEVYVRAEKKDAFEALVSKEFLEGIA